MDRVILHSDMNGFYASAECMEHHELRLVPMAVAGDVSKRHGIILAKNDLAKRCGVQTGEAIWMAQRKCPELVLRPPNYSLYMRLSRLARGIYLRYSDRVEPFGPDEAWIDLTQSPCLAHQTPVETAHEIRRTIKRELGLTVSIGVSYNKIFAKFGSDYKKPDAVTLITKDNYKQLVWPKPADDLLYIGRATKRKLADICVETVGEVAALPREQLRAKFGKIGDVLWSFANGYDVSEVKLLNEARMDTDYEVKSVGNSLTAPRDLVTDEDALMLITLLSESVGQRLREAGFEARTVSVHLRDKELVSFTRQRHLTQPTALTADIIRAASALYDTHYDMRRSRGLRSIGVCASGLMPARYEHQLSFFEDTERRIKAEALERSMDGLRRRFGNNAVRRAACAGESMSLLDIKAEHVVHPVGYFQSAAGGA